MIQFLMNSKFWIDHQPYSLVSSSKLSSPLHMIDGILQLDWWIGKHLIRIFHPQGKVQTGKQWVRVCFVTKDLQTYRIRPDGNSTQVVVFE